jgi:hypothetical protein
MKRLPCIIVFFCFYTAQAQNEFASTSFYQDFKKICIDGQTGFSACKGAALKNQYPELQEEFNMKCTLPPADSGKLVIPAIGNPYAVFYFEPAKNRIKTDQKALGLRESILTAYGQPLYVRTSTTVINEHPYTNSYFFTDANEGLATKALFRISIYYKEEKYYLLLEIRGIPPPKGK